MFWGHQADRGVDTANVSRGWPVALKKLSHLVSVQGRPNFLAACVYDHCTPPAKCSTLLILFLWSRDRNGTFAYFFSPVEGVPQATEKRHFLQLCAWIGTVCPKQQLPPLFEKNGAVLAQCSGERWGGRERGGWAPCCLGQ